MTNVGEQRFHTRLTVEECQQRLAQLQPRAGVINPYWGEPRLLFGSHSGTHFELFAVSRAVHNFPRRFRGQLHRVSDGTVIGGEFESGGLGAVLLSFVLWSMVALLAGFFVAGLLSYLRWVAVFDATAGIVVMCICVGFALLAFGLKAALERATRKEKAFVLDYVGGELKGVQIAPAETQGA